MLQSDSMAGLEHDSEYKDAQFDFIQMHVRKFCVECILFAWNLRNLSKTKLTSDFMLCSTVTIVYFDCIIERHTIRANVRVLQLYLTF